MKKEFTHTGIMRGTFKPYRVELRKTKRYWITKHGARLSLKDGFPSDDWPTFHLDLSSIKEIENDK